MRIALCGGLRSGKDTFANYLSAYGFERLAFGDAMKEQAHLTFPWVPREPKPRDLYIQYGQAMRAIDQEVWINHLNLTMNNHLAVGHDRFVISDVRQRNEFEWCKRNGFILIYIYTDSDIQAERAAALGEDTSLVGNELDMLITPMECDIIVDNVGSLDDYYDTLECLIEHLEIT